MMARFQMRIDRPWAPALLLGGATKRNSYVDVTPEAVTFHFGAIFNHTEDWDDIHNVTARRWPWWMGVGWRSNLRGLIGLIGSYNGVVEVGFESRSRAFAVLPMNRIAVSLEDPEGFIKAIRGARKGAELEAAAGAAAEKKPVRRTNRGNGRATKRRAKRDGN